MFNGDDLILNPLFIFEPTKGLEHWGDVRMFGCASNSACKSISNMLKALNLSDYYIHYIHYNNYARLISGAQMEYWLATSVRM